MSNYLNLEPEELRRIAGQHHRRAIAVRKWGEIPHDWLADYKRSHGTIADTVREALVDYYNRRYIKAERQAATHERTRDDLLAAARAMEDTDKDSGGRVEQAGGFGNPTPVGSTSAGPVGSAPPRPVDPRPPVRTGPGTPYESRTDPGRSSAAARAALPGIDAAGRTAASPPASMPLIYAPAPVPAAATAPAAPAAPSTGTPPPPTGMPSTGAIPPVGAAAPAHSAAATVAATFTPPFSPAAVNESSTPGASAAPRMPEPLAAGPLAAARSARGNRSSLPSLVVGDRVDDDFLLVRTLLAATLAATGDSAPGLEWAAAVLRTQAGPVVLLTSNEGRGWLPPGLFLPSEVTIPWKWDGGRVARRVFQRMEGTAAPARMLAELGVLIPRMKITALVSSAAISENLRAALGDDVALEGGVSAGQSAVDFGSPAPGLADRLAIAGSAESLKQAITVPDSEIRARCIELARDADERVRAAGSASDLSISASRAWRPQILEALAAGRSVPVNWQEQRGPATGVPAAMPLPGVDHFSGSVGVRRDVPEPEARRAIVFERRVEELLFLLAAGEPDRQTLRDVLYAYGQITEHPQFPAAARVAVAADLDGAVPQFEGDRGVEVGSYAVRSAGHGGVLRPSPDY